MSDSGSPPDSAPAPRGEAAWKQNRTEIAARNDKARKEGKERRDAYQREKQGRRQRAERIEQDEVFAADEKRRNAGGVSGNRL